MDSGASRALQRWGLPLRGLGRPRAGGGPPDDGQGEPPDARPDARADRRAPGTGARAYWLLALAVVLLAAIGLFAGERLSRVAAENATAAAADARARTDAGYLAGELRKYRLLPLILADYPDVQRALVAGTGDAVARLNARLELIAARTDAAVIYVVDGSGQTIAASNWRSPRSFVGQNYAFRPYFYDAMARGAAEQFGLGTVSRRPGLFLARRVPDALGVIVVKVEFGPLEAMWAHQAGPTMVRDRNGVIILASQPGWRLRATRRLGAAELAAIERGRLYGHGPLPPIAPDLLLSPRGRIAGDQRGQHYIVSTLPVPVAGWSLSTLEPLDPALSAATAEARIALLIVILVVVVVAGVAIRAREARQLRAAAQRELEHQVALRTAELRGANERLIHESRERERNEVRLRAAREELAQSNRLATLGQITAGIAHEINQPLAALRTFAENAGVMLVQGRPHDAVPNLDRIVGLSQRIGDITGELRLFARSERGHGPVALETAIEGALLLIGDRLRHAGIAVERRRAPGRGGQDPSIASDRVRIEQILINLLQNACDALDGRPDPRIVIATEVGRGEARVTVSDNGPGIGRKARARLFKSFATTKPNGLGLGLVISRDLAREVGGDLVHLAHEEGGLGGGAGAGAGGGAGASFVLRLPIA